MKTSRLILFALPLLLAACSTPPAVETSAANSDTPAATVAPMPRLSGDDAATQKTNELLAAAGADNTDALKPMKSGMGPMDHAAMGHGAKADPNAKMDHSQHGVTPAAASKGAFTCPMHAEVKSNQPGKCAKCGMALKPAATKPGTAPHQDHQP